MSEEDPRWIIPEKKEDISTANQLSKMIDYVLNKAIEHSVSTGKSLQSSLDFILKEMEEDD